MPDEKMINEAKKELARRELERRESLKNKNPVEGLVESYKKVLPSAGQAIGSTIGAISGGIIGQPVAGQTVGGTLGRTLGTAQSEFINQFKEDPGKAILRQLVFGPIGGPVSGMSSAQRKELGAEALKTAGLETITGGAFKLAGMAGEGVLKALLGQNVAERGIQVGFRKLLNPKLYQEGIDKAAATKIGMFFNNLLNRTGKQVGEAIKPYADDIVDKDEIAINISNSLSKRGAGSIKDLADATTSKAQLNLAKVVDNKVKSLLSKEKVTVDELWKTRQELDKIIFSKKWSDDLKSYLMDLRKSLNSPLTKNEEVAKAFGRYEFVIRKEKELGDKLATTFYDGSTFSPKAGALIDTILGEGVGKGELIKTFKQLDSFLKADDRIVNDLLDTAAATALNKNIELMGFVTRGALGSIGGRKAIAGAAAATQTPAAKTARTFIRSTAPTAMMYENK